MSATSAFDSLLRCVGLRTLNQQFLFSYALMFLLAVTASVALYLSMSVSPETINVAGAQRMLSQKMTKEALLLRQPEVEEFIKRVIALPGETVEGHDNAVYVDGRKLIEPYLPPGTSIGDFDPVKVPPGHLWVMGDNRTNSSDSRVFGPIRADTIVGRAILRVWPPQRTAFL